MRKHVSNALICAEAQVLMLCKTPEELSRRLEDIASSIGTCIPGWENRLREELQSYKGHEAAVRAIDERLARQCIRDADGTLLYEEQLLGDEYRQIRITFRRSAPKEEQLTVECIPDVSIMSVRQLSELIEELTEELAELESEEPEDTESDGYAEWEDAVDSLTGLIEEAEEQLEEFTESSSDGEEAAETD